jgi:hypothetical protein
MNNEKINILFNFIVDLFCGNKPYEKNIMNNEKINILLKNILIPQI